MRLPILFVTGILAVDAAAAADEIVPPGSKLELLYTRSAPIQGGLTEGVAVAPDGSMYFSDIPFGNDKGMILRFDPKSKTTTVFAHDSHKSNGLMFDAKGFLIACEGADGGGRAVVALGRQDGPARGHRRPLSGQAVQRLQRPVHRREGADLLHRPALPGYGTARAGASRGLPDRHGWDGRRDHPRRREAQRHRDQSRPEDALRRRPQQRHRSHRPRGPEAQARSA